MDVHVDAITYEIDALGDRDEKMAYRATHKDHVKRRLTEIIKLQSEIGIDSILQPNANQNVALKDLLREMKYYNYFRDMTCQEWYNFFLEDPLQNFVFNIHEVEPVEPAEPAIPNVDQEPTFKREVNPIDVAGHKKRRKIIEDDDDELNILEGGNQFVVKCERNAVAHIQDQFDDLSNRTRMIIDDYVNDFLSEKERKKTSILTFDGHGRTLFLMLHHFFSRDAEHGGQLELPYFDFYEIDEQTQIWHDIMFPLGDIDPDGNPMVHCHYRNFFDIFGPQNDYYVWTTFKRKFDVQFNSVETSEAFTEFIETNIIYLNFLGLPTAPNVHGADQNDYRQHLIFFIIAITKLVGANVSLFVSFSARTIRKYFSYDLYRETMHNLLNARFHCVSRRKLFITLKYGIKMAGGYSKYIKYSQKINTLLEKMNQ